MSSVFIDHKTLRPYYNQDDVIITNIYEKGVTSRHRICTYHVHRKHIIIDIKCCDMIISFNIESKNVSVGHVCAYNFIVSKFNILKGKNDYPHLILRYGNKVTLILEIDYVTNVIMQSVDKSKCDLIKNCWLYDDDYAHRIIKVNDFSPSVLYHTSRSLCGHNVRCSFDDPHKIYYVGNEYNLDIIDPLIDLAKINGVNKKVMQLLNVNDRMIKDIVLHIAVIMYHIV